MLASTAAPTPTPTPVHAHDPGGFLILLGVGFILGGGFVVGAGGGVVTVVTRYGTGLDGGNYLARAVLDRLTGGTSTGSLRDSPVTIEIPSYALLGALYAVIPAVGALLGMFEGVGPDPERVVVRYTAMFVAVAWIGSVVALSWLDPDARTELPVLLSLAAEFGVFGTAMAAGLALLRLAQPVRGSLHGAAVVFLLAGTSLGVLTPLARRVPALPAPGDRAYAGGVLGLGAAVAVPGVLLDAVGTGVQAERVLAVGGAVLVLGALAALGSVE